MAKAPVTQDSTKTINELIKRVAVLEEKATQAEGFQSAVVKAMQSAGGTIGNFYGMGAVGAVFDAVAERIAKK